MAEDGSREREGGAYNTSPHYEGQRARQGESGEKVEQRKGEEAGDDDGSL